MSDAAWDTAAPAEETLLRTPAAAEATPDLAAERPSLTVAPADLAEAPARSPLTVPASSWRGPEVSPLPAPMRPLPDRNIAAPTPMRRVGTGFSPAALPRP